MLLYAADMLAFTLTLFVVFLIVEICLCVM